MKTVNSLTLDYGLRELDDAELTMINGGEKERGFWGDLAAVLGATAHFVAAMVKDAHNRPIRPSEYR